MAQDIRELLKKDSLVSSEKLTEGHQDRFLAKLEEALPKEESKFNFYWFKIAASILVVFSLSILGYNQINKVTTNANIVSTDQNPKGKEGTVKRASPLAAISPQYEEVENSILASIKKQLSQIKIDDKNRELVESFRLRLGSLDKEYQHLSKELVDVGPSLLSVEAMMENLKMRLSLLKRLKDKLKELERIDHENYNEIQA